MVSAPTPYWRGQFAGFCTLGATSPQRGDTQKEERKFPAVRHNLLKHKQVSLGRKHESTQEVGRNADIATAITITYTHISGEIIALLYKSELKEYSVLLRICNVFSSHSFGLND